MLINCLVVWSKPFIVRDVAWTRPVIHRHDKPWCLRPPPNPAGGLNIFRAGFRLPVDHHQPQPVDVDAHGNHIRRQQNIDGLRLTGGNFQLFENLWNLRGSNSARQFTVFILDFSRLPTAPFGKIFYALDDVVFNQPERTTEFAQAVKVADQCGIGICNARSVLSKLLTGYLQQNSINTHQGAFHTSSRSANAEIISAGSLRDRLSLSEEGVACM